MSGAREPSMEDILASIKRVIAEEKEIRAAAPPPGPAVEDEPDEDVLELDSPVEAREDPPLPEEEAPADLGEPLLDNSVADASRSSLESLASLAAAAPPAPAANPLEDMVMEMLRPMLKQWLDDHLPKIVDEHVKREITRITGRRL